MDSAPVPAPVPASVTFADGLGTRQTVIDHARNEALEMLFLRAELTAVPSFEAVLRERVSDLATFRHGCYAQVRRVERLDDAASTLVLVSDATAGVRLSKILEFAERPDITLDIDAALCLLRQLVPAIAMLHEEATDIAHGAIAAERLIVTPGARIVVVEHVLGSALEQLHLSHEKYWRELRIALPKAAGFGHRTDVTQLGVVALSLILGRRLLDAEGPSRLSDLVASAWAVSVRGGLEPLPAGLRAWLKGALQLDAKRSFGSAVEAQEELERVLGESDYLAAPTTLESFLAQYRTAFPPVVPVASLSPVAAVAAAMRMAPAAAIESTARFTNVAPGASGAPAARVAASAHVAPAPAAPPAHAKHAAPYTAAAPVLHVAPAAPVPHVTPAVPFAFAARVAPAAPVTPAAPFEFAERVAPAAVTPAAPFAFAARVPPAAPVTPAAPFEFAARVPPAAPVTPAAPFAFAARVPPAAPVTPAAPFEFAARVPPAAPVTPAAPFAFAARVPAAAPVTPAAPFEFAARVAPAAPVTHAAPFEFAARVPPAAPVTPAAPFEFAPRAAPAAQFAPASPVHATAPAAGIWPPASHASTPPAPRKDPVTWTATPLDIESIRPQETEEEQPRRKPWQLAAAAIVLVALAGAGVTAARRFAAPSAATAEGTLIVTTNPAGARLFVDGVEQGATPFTVTLKVGAHALELRGAGAPRHVPITMTAGAQMSQYIDLPSSTVSPVGQLQIKTEPAGARISVDGVARGTSPVTVNDLTPGEHAVLLDSSFGSVKQTVTIEPGITASLTVPLAPPEGAPVSGWIAVSAPSEVQVFENGRLLGTSQTERLMIPAGRHELAIVNETLGYRATRTVQVSPGKVSPLRLEFPKGTIAVNAIPWAEVWVDGEKIGDTPIGNLELTVGPHEFLFRHPELGEQRHAATITLTAPARLSVDLRKK
jgi:PEGA domain-containing protein